MSKWSILRTNRLIHLPIFILLLPTRWKCSWAELDKRLGILVRFFVYLASSSLQAGDLGESLKKVMIFKIQKTVKMSNLPKWEDKLCFIADESAATKSPRPWSSRGFGERSRERRWWWIGHRVSRWAVWRCDQAGLKPFSLLLPQ